MAAHAANGVWSTNVTVGAPGNLIASLLSGVSGTALLSAYAQNPNALAWDPANANTDIVLSLYNTIATPQNANSTTTQGVRSKQSHSFGKWYFEISSNSFGASSGYGCGICNSSWNLEKATFGTTGNATNVDWNADGGVWGNPGQLKVIASVTGAVTCGFAVDLDHLLMWCRVGSGNWNNDVIANQNPATNTGGIDISSISPAGPYFIAFASQYNGSAAQLNVGDTPFANAAPSGGSNGTFLPWIIKDPAASIVGYGTTVTQANLIEEIFPAIQGTATVGAVVAKTWSGSAGIVGGATVSALANLKEEAFIGIGGSAAVLMGTGAYNYAYSSAYNGGFSSGGGTQWSGSSGIVVTGTVGAQANLIEAAFAGISETTTVTADASPQRFALAGIVGTATLTAQANLIEAAFAAIGGTATVTADASPQRFVSSAILGTATLAVQANLIEEAFAAIQGSATVGAVAQKTAYPTISLQVTGTVGAPANLIEAAFAAISETTTVHVDASPQRFVSAAISGTATLTVKAQLIEAAFAAIGGTGTVSALANLHEEAFAAIGGTGLMGFSGGQYSSAYSWAYNGGVQPGPWQGSAGIVGTAIVTADATPQRFVSSGVAGAATLAVSAQKIAYPVPSLQGSATVAAPAQLIETAFAAISELTTVSSDASPQRFTGAAIGGSATVGASAQVHAAAFAAINETTTVGAPANLIEEAFISIQGTGTVNCAFGAQQGQAGIVGTATVGAIAQKIAYPVVTLAESTTVDAAGNIVASVQATIAVTGTVQVSGFEWLAASGILVSTTVAPASTYIARPAISINGQAIVGANASDQGQYSISGSAIVGANGIRQASGAAGVGGAATVGAHASVIAGAGAAIQVTVTVDPVANCNINAIAPLAGSCNVVAPAVLIEAVLANILGTVTLLSQAQPPPTAARLVQTDSPTYGMSVSDAAATGLTVIDALEDT